ncbi:TPA: hypothetical protein DDW35_13775 [Candidatus Sumerlaeota bacterium]|nr:hypothetical protein [Candidatus Sumerlaeota bacterium]
MKDSVDPLLSVVRKTKSKVVVSAFPNGGADSTTKVYDLSDYAGPYQEMESSAGWIDIASAKDIIIASISDMIPVSVRQNLLNSWGNFRTLMSIEERLLSLLSDVECGSVHGDQLSGELVCLLADIIAGSEMQHA